MKIINYAEEAISFQSPAFKITLLDIMQKLIDAKFQNNQDANKSPLKTELEKLIFDNSGVRVNVQFDAPYYSLAIGVEVLHSNNIMHHDFVREITLGKPNDIIEKAIREKQSGHVDLKNAQVSGWMSDVVLPLYFDYMQNCRGFFTNGELAAVLAHEVGHAFVNFEMITHSVRTNQVLAAVNKASVAPLSKEEFTVILKKGGSVLGDDDSLVELAETKDARIIATVIVAQANRQLASELGSKNYDLTAFEQCADQFAARLGLGRELVTGLAKIHKRYGYPEYSGVSRIAIYAMECFALFGYPTIAVIALTATMPLISVFMAGLWCAGTFFAGDGQRDMTYDDVKVRYKRVREQMVTYLKSPKIDPKQVKQVLADIAIVDKEIEEAKEFKGLLRIVGNWLWSSNNKAAKMAELQRQLEELAANDLYMRAAQLRTMNA